MKVLLTLFAAVVTALVFTSADLKAAPIGPLHAESGSALILVAQGCGVGWHRGPFGGCRRNLSPAWPCWWTRGPYGRWHLVCH